MKRRLPFDRNKLIDGLEKISSKKMILTAPELAKEIGIGHNALLAFMDRKNDIDPIPRTIRKIDAFIKQNEGQ